MITKQIAIKYPISYNYNKQTKNISNHKTNQTYHTIPYHAKTKTKYDILYHGSTISIAEHTTQQTSRKPTYSPSNLSDLHRGAKTGHFQANDAAGNQRVEPQARQTPSTWYRVA